MSGMSGTEVISMNRQVDEIASNVRRARRLQDWTQAQLAEQAGVATGTVNRIENGMPVRPGNLRAVLDVLQIPQVSERADVDGGIELAVEMVRRWLEAMDEADRNLAVQALTRFTLLDQWRSR